MDFKTFSNGNPGMPAVLREPAETSLRIAYGEKNGLFWKAALRLAERSRSVLAQQNKKSRRIACGGLQDAMFGVVEASPP
ncbi:hypothetical protein [Burkholderia sp. Ac-20365]|uniref:hypothetical protein n=1 Tax=Burkholderia sp. Ac-20365 TaxID=2703897 RepID=UPI00197C6568|nr:hypothetical protein [Burkholderia sp. Ac-20365]MBN3767521.1 hypothetical protein [Burkholderia sp. Ac-20365]